MINACNLCEQVADKCEVFNTKKINVQRHYLLYKVVPSKLRTHESFMKNSRNAEKLNRVKDKPKILKSSKRIKGVAAVHQIPLIDLSTCVAPEYMHSALLGITW